MPACEVRHSSQRNPQVGATWCLVVLGWGQCHHLNASRMESGLLMPMAYLYFFTSSSSCSFFAMTPFLRACCIRSLTMGHDSRNNRIECADSLSNRFWIRYKASICTIIDPCSGWVLVDRCAHCSWKQDLNFEWVCWLFLHLIKNLSANALFRNPFFFFTGSTKAKGSPASWSWSTSDRSLAWFLPDLPPHSPPWFAEIPRRKAIPLAVKATPLQTWLFLASSLLTCQDFSLKVSFFSPQVVGVSGIKWSLSVLSISGSSFSCLNWITEIRQQ